MITAEKRGRGPNDTHPFLLMSDGAPAGSRLEKGHGHEGKNAFPLRYDPLSKMHAWECGWNRYPDQKSADAAAAKLEKYLSKASKN